MLNTIEKGDPISSETLEEGGALLVDKPVGWTSFDVVNKLRYTIKSKLDRKKYKVGHAGTLDPLATGLLVICISSYTKKINDLIGMDKSYSGVMKFWETTESEDAEMPVNTYYPRKKVAAEQLSACRASFIGDIAQIPPMFSAIKKDGVPLYKLARKGQSTSLTSRPVTIHSFEIEKVNWPFIEFKVECSKGTYIRALVRDFAEKLGSGAYLHSLKRTAIGPFSLAEAWDLENLINRIEQVE